MLLCYKGAQVGVLLFAFSLTSQDRRARRGNARLVKEFAAAGTEDNLRGTGGLPNALQRSLPYGGNFWRIGTHRHAVLGALRSDAGTHEVARAGTDDRESGFLLRC